MATQYSSSTATPTDAPTPWSKEYPLVDGWRGIAALLVVCHHALGVEYGHWGVLIFFVLSGYCITASADACHARGLSASQFLKRRLHRIYPPYFFALLFFLITRMAKGHLTNSNPLGSWTAVQYLQNFTLTQWLTLVAHPASHAPKNPTLMVSAFWSLNYEIQFYLAMTCLLFVARRAKMVEAGVHFLALTFVVFLWVAIFGRICRGFLWDYWLLFAIGSFVYFRLVHAVASRTLCDIALGATCVISGMITFFHPCNAQAQLLSGSGRAVFAEIFAGAGFGLLLVASRRFSEPLMSSGLGHVLRFLGLISYSLYLIHQFNLHLVASLTQKILFHSASPLLVVPLTLSLHIALAAAFWLFFERPFLNPKIRTFPASR